MRTKVIRVPDSTGRKRQVGKIEGDTFVLFKRVLSRHLFRNGEKTLEEALRKGTGCWAVDLETIEVLSNKHGVRFVEVPTKDGRTWRVSVDLLLGSKGFTMDYGGQREQVALPLKYWTEVTDE